MASKDISKGKIAPKTTASSSNSSCVPPRKYGAHTGLKFQWNLQKDTTAKSFTVESRIEKKGNVPTVDTVTQQIAQNSIQKEVHITSGTRKFISTLEVDLKTSRVSKAIHNTVLMKNVQGDSESFIENENNFCSNSATSFSNLQPRTHSSKISNSQTWNTLKHHESSSNASNLSSLNVRQISKARSPTRELIPENVKNGGTVTMQFDENNTYKGRTDSGTRKCTSTGKEDEKLARMKQSVHKSLSMKNVQNDSKISTESEIEGLCSNVSTSLRVLQPQPQTSKISKSQSSNKLKPPRFSCNFSKLPNLNARQISTGRPAELEESTTRTRQTKCGFHTGLRFSFKGKNAIPVDSNFNRTPSLPKNECFKNEKGNFPPLGSVTKQIVKNEIHKEVHSFSGTRKFISTLEEDVKTSRVSESIHKTVLMKNVQA